MLKGFRRVVILGLLIPCNACLSPGVDSNEAASGLSDAASEEESGTGLTNEFDLLEGINELEFDASGEVSLTASTDSASDAYILVLRNSGDSTAIFQLGDEGSQSPAALIAGLDLDLTEDFHEQLREYELGLEGGIPESAPQSKALMAAATVGSTRSFKVLSSLSSGTYDVIEAELRYASSHVHAYVDVRNDSALTDAELADLFADFDEVIPAEREMFGQESDVNGDGHFTVLLTQVVNELGAAGGGIITGFFYAADLYDDSSLPSSNEMEILYTLVPDPSGQFGVAISKEFSLSNLLPSVLPHEFQHMISYNQHVFLKGGAGEEAFLNEALSHLAEDIYLLDANDYMAGSGIENPSRLAYYLSSPSTICFTCGSSLAQRGGSYLFVRYLYEQAEQGNVPNVTSGAGLIRELLATSLTGVTNLVSATSQDEADFDQLLGVYSLALYLSDTGLTTDPRYQFNGINLRASQEDNRGTVLEGPALGTVSDFPYLEALSSSGFSYLYLSGSDFAEQGGSIVIATNQDTTLSGYLIELKVLSE